MITIVVTLGKEEEKDATPVILQQVRTMEVIMIRAMVIVTNYTKDYRDAMVMTVQLTSGPAG